MPLTVDMNTEDLSSIDWSRLFIGIGPKLKDLSDEKNIRLTQMEMRILRLMLTKPVPGTDEVAARVFPGLHKLVHLLEAWEQWSMNRGHP